MTRTPEQRTTPNVIPLLRTITKISLGGGATKYSSTYDVAWVRSIEYAKATFERWRAIDFSNHLLENSW